MTLSKDHIKQTREKLKLTQVQFGQLLGVHPLTVSKWERGQLAPTPHQQALIQSFGVAGNAKENVGEQVAGLLVTAGVAIALFALLHAAFEDKK